MAVRRMPDDAPEEFLAGVERLRAVRLRPEVILARPDLRLAGRPTRASAPLTTPPGGRVVTANP